MGDRKEMNVVQIGDWVHSYGAGIWKVYRTETFTSLDPVSRTERKRSLVFSKRFLSNSFKLSFGEECCDPSLISPLAAHELVKLKKLISSKPELYEAFAAYVPKPISCIYNARIAATVGMTPEEATEAVPADPIFTEAQIAPFLESCGFKVNRMPYWTAQFISENHRIEEGNLVYRFSRIIK